MGPCSSRLGVTSGAGLSGQQEHVTCIADRLCLAHRRGGCICCQLQSVCVWADTGDSDSDDEGLPASYIAQKQQMRAQQQQEQQNDSAPQQQEQQLVEANRAAEAESTTTAGRSDHTPAGPLAANQEEAASHMIAAQPGKDASAEGSELESPHAADQQEEPMLPTAAGIFQRCEQSSQDAQAQEQQQQAQQDLCQTDANLPPDPDSEPIVCEAAWRASNSSNAQQTPVRLMLVGVP